MEPVIPLYMCSTCGSTYKDHAGAMSCFMRGIQALKIRRGSIFKANFECRRAEDGKSVEFYEGESFFVVSRRLDNQNIGHYRPFFGFSFSGICQNGSQEFAYVSTDPAHLREIVAPEFIEIRDYLMRVSNSSWARVEAAFGIKKDKLSRGRIALLPETLRERQENLQCALAEAVAREHYEAARIYRDGLDVIEEEIAWSEYQR